MARIVALALVFLGATACGKPPREHREVKASLYSCFDPRTGGRILKDQPGFCEREREANIYKEAFEKNEPVIELITMGVGELIWEKHGHIAMCLRYDQHKRGELALSLRDPNLTPEQRVELISQIKKLKKDICYNYGIANFHEPLGMAWGFFRGTKSFWAGEQDVDFMLSIYIGADRTVYAQPLPLDSAQKAQIIAKLESDVLEQNKYYAYDHFLDNCTTRVRDIIDNATANALAKMDEPTDGRTFRDLAREGFFGMRVPLLITDIAMGRSTDQVPTYWQRMFLPQYLREAVQKKFDIQPVVLYQRVGEPQPEDSPSGRVIFGLLIVALTSLVVLTRWLGRFQRTAIVFATFPYILLGSVMWFLAIISPLDYVKWNETLLVFLPLDVLLWGFLSGERRKKYARGRVVMLLALSLLDVVGVFHQPLLAPILWPLIPCAVVGFWRDEWSRTKPEAPPEPKSKKKK